MQQEPTRSPENQELNQELNQEPNQEILGESDSDFLLTPAQEAAMLSEFGASVDDSKYNLQDPDAEDRDSKSSSNLNPDLKLNQNTEKTAFHNHFIGHMDLLADQRTVMKYLDAHQGWFRRCANPFKADPIGETGYAMGVGKVGAMGFQVDARVGLNLLPPDENSVYRITTIPIPEQLPQVYDVDFQAEMRLQEQALDVKADHQVGKNALMTSVEWDLNLTVTLQFPQFIQRLSQDMLQKTGDGVLGFIVKRVSKSLTAKVQEDFHKTHDIKVPKHIKLRR